jgi:hypothetical protein
MKQIEKRWEGHFGSLLKSSVARSGRLIPARLSVCRSKDLPDSFALSFHFRFPFNIDSRFWLG